MFNIFFFIFSYLIKVEIVSFILFLVFSLFFLTFFFYDAIFSVNIVYHICVWLLFTFFYHFCVVFSSVFLHCFYGDITATISLIHGFVNMHFFNLSPLCLLLFNLSFPMLNYMGPSSNCLYFF